MLMRSKLLAATVFGASGLMAGSAQAQAPATPAAESTVRNAVAGNDMPGPIDNLQDLADTGKIAFKLVDTNNDGQISQKEATDAANLLVGGFFFRADTDGNGVLTQEEAKAARESLLNQQPLLRFVLARVKSATPAGGTPNPGMALASILDTNNDKQIQATELRQAVSTAVQGLYATADTNRDGQMSPTELNAAVVGLARAVAQATFQAADRDSNGQISRDEYNKAIIAPADMVFAILDANNDGQLSPQEAQSAERIIMAQLRNLIVPEARNSVANLLSTGRAPGQVAPVPTIPIPARPVTGVVPR